MIVGIEPGQNVLVLWIYALKGRMVNQILDVGVTPLSVEVTRRDLVVREPAESPDYDICTVYSWDDRSGTMIEKTVGFDELRPKHRRRGRS
ncbi:hypothetical protein Stsp01_53340 [Streptomyces sp. NBRC 13847]|uniref:hypothetical protein n=1 Tax=Streptomyces TaxID=1883 RepID=UPI0024A55C0E|nr:hypothetical protein [Streptomyces sp. NBRC 13847]GLW18591.1 hypothetical protein Stsp01_53340 [Streptomyces sp. NBRC 13847]